MKQTQIRKEKQTNAQFQSETDKIIRQQINMHVAMD